jgi:hypothetical protein
MYVQALITTAEKSLPVIKDIAQKLGADCFFAD